MLAISARANMLSALALIAAVMAALGAIANFVPFFARLIGVPISSWAPRRRRIIAIALLLLAMIAGYGAYHGIASSGTAIVKTSSAAVAEHPRPITFEAPPDLQPPASTTAVVTTHSTNVATASGVKPATRVSRARTKPRIRIHDLDGKPVPVLEAIANNSYPNQWIRGTLREALQRNDDFQGIISSHLTLEVVITDINEVTLDAFVLETHGAGFTDDAAHNQAQQRLAEALRDRIREGTP
jgi:hypothetical protein